MKIVGLTGGIGSGKTTVAKMFEALGVPVYIADKEAKELMNRSPYLRQKLIDLLGEEAYDETGLNRPFVASKIFQNKHLLEKINEIVHPEVRKHFHEWLKKQSAVYVIKEAAIIFEQNMQSQYDKVILVTADKQQRIKRVLKRDHTTSQKINAIMENQLDDSEKIKLADYVLENTDLVETQKKVETLHKTLLKTFL